MKTSTSDLAGPLLSLSVTLALGLAACASAPSDPSDPSPSGGADAVRSSATSVALSVAAIRPVPYCPAQARACFPGGSVELVVADALAECGANSLVDEVADADLVDVYLTTVRQHMVSARCHEGDSSLFDWLSQRADGACNVDPQTNLPATFPLTPLSPALDETYGAESFQCWDGSGESADELPAFVMKHIHGAAVNACLAQKLRAIMPGTAGAEGLVPGRSQLQGGERGERPAVAPYELRARGARGSRAATSARRARGA